MRGERSWRNDGEGLSADFEVVVVSIRCEATWVLKYSISVDCCSRSLHHLIDLKKK